MTKYVLGRLSTSGLLGWLKNATPATQSGVADSGFFSQTLERDATVILRWTGAQPKVLAGLTRMHGGQTGQTPNVADSVALDTVSIKHISSLCWCVCVFVCLCTCVSGIVC